MLFPFFFNIGEVNGNTMTPSSRVSAINIVGDLLRKVGVSHNISVLITTVKAFVVVVAIAILSVGLYL